MAKKKEIGVSKGLKALFLIHGIVSIIIGVLLFFIPEIWAKMAKYDLLDPEPMRIIGAFSLALTLKDWLGFIAKQWSEVRIIVIFEIAYTFFGALASLYAVLTLGAPTAAVMNTVVYVVFFVVWTYFYLKYRK